MYSLIVQLQIKYIICMINNISVKPCVIIVGLSQWHVFLNKINKIIP